MASKLFQGELVAKSGNFDIVFNPSFFSDKSGGFFYESEVPGCNSGSWGDAYHFKLVFSDERRGDELTRLGKSILDSPIREIPNILWTYFREEIPTDPETGVIQESFMVFPKGTKKEAVASWFEKTFKGFSVAALT